MDAVAPSNAAGGAARVEIRGLTKTFPGTRALKDVDMDVRAGEIHGLVGGNGSGKSTLIKILTGVYQADPGGLLRIEGEEVDPSESTPEKARAARIYAVHQDLGVFIDMSVAENLAIGYRYETGFGGKIRWGRQKQRARKLIEQFDIAARPDTPLTALSQSVRTQVAIARALQSEEDGSGGMLILDEPTASLPAHEVALLLETLKKYASEGRAILHTSHRLDDVLALSDRVTVLRDGANVGTYESADLDEQKLTMLMIGRNVDLVFPPMPEVPKVAPIVEVRSLSAGPLRDVNFAVHPGEVLGLAGLLGSGRSEVLRAIFGDLKLESGEILVEGEALKARNPADAMSKGIAFVPEDRASEASFANEPVDINVSMANVPDYWTFGRMDYRKLRSDAREMVSRFEIKTPSERAVMATLSGGNQQKTILARWLRRNPRVLLLDEPTQGVDVGARADIYGQIRDAVAGGAAAIVVASDFEELAHVCDRIVVLREGRVTAEIAREEVSVERLTEATYTKGTK